MAEAKAHAVCVPSPSSRARRYMRAHHKSRHRVRKNPAMSHQPPSLRGGMMLIPYSGLGGSSANQGSWRKNWIGLQLTEANMCNRMIAKAAKPDIKERIPRYPR